MSIELSKVSKSLGRKPNNELRPREYLTNDEVELLIRTARTRKDGRTNLRDSLLIEMMYRHALRASEVVALKWTDINWAEGTIQIDRAKGGSDGIHPINIDEFRHLQHYKTKFPGRAYIFNSEGANGPLNRRSIWDIIKRVGEAANFPFPIHPHMLRHAKGYNLVNRGKDIRVIASYLGHKSIDSTMRYTQLNHRAFKDLADNCD